MVDRSFRTLLPLTRKVRLDPGELVRELRLFVEQSGASVRIDPRMMTQADQRPGGLRGLFSAAAPPERVLFEVDGVRLRVHTVGEPFEKRSRIHRFVNPAHWTRGLGEFADHRAHIVVQEAGIEGEEGPDAVFDRAAAVTATSAVVARLTDPVGVVWSTAENAIPVSLFRECLEELTEGRAPLRFWMRWHMLPPDELQDAQPGLVTHGLAPFIGREVLARPSLVEAQHLIGIMLAFARRLVDERASVAERDRVTLDDGTDLDVRLRGPGKMSDAPVYELAVPGMDAPPPREPAPDPLAMPSMPGTPDEGESQRERRRPRRGGLGALLGLGQDDEDEDRPLPYIPPPPGREGGANPVAAPGGAGHGIPGGSDSDRLAAAFAAPGGRSPDAAAPGPAAQPMQDGADPASRRAAGPGAASGWPEENGSASRPAEAAPPAGGVPPAPPLDLTLWATPVPEEPPAADAAPAPAAQAPRGADPARQNPGAVAAGAPGDAAQDTGAAPGDGGHGTRAQPAAEETPQAALTPSPDPEPMQTPARGSDAPAAGSIGPAHAARAAEIDRGEVPDAPTGPDRGAHEPAGQPRNIFARGATPDAAPGTAGAPDRPEAESPAPADAPHAGAQDPAPEGAPSDPRPAAAPELSEAAAASRVFASLRARAAAPAGASSMPGADATGMPAGSGAGAAERGAANHDTGPAGHDPARAEDAGAAGSAAVGGSRGSRAGDAADALAAWAEMAGAGGAEAPRAEPQAESGGPRWLFAEAHRGGTAARDDGQAGQGAAPSPPAGGVPDNAAPARPGASTRPESAGAAGAPGDTAPDAGAGAAVPDADESRPGTAPPDAAGASADSTAPATETRGHRMAAHDGETGGDAVSASDAGASGAPGAGGRDAGAVWESPPPPDEGAGDHLAGAAAAAATRSVTTAHGRAAVDTDAEADEMGEDEYVLIGGRRIRVISGGKTGT